MPAGLRSNIVPPRSTISIENPMGNYLAKVVPTRFHRESRAASFNRFYPK
jgi:hypothetical protein